MAGSSLTRGGQEFDGRRTDPAFALNGLDDDRASFIGDGSVELFDVVAIDKLHRAWERIEILAILRLSGYRERTERAAVKRSVERNHLGLRFPAPIMAGSANDFHCALDGFSTAVREEGALETRGLAEFLRKQSLVFVVIKVREMDDLGGLVANDLHDPRMRMAERVHP